MDWDRAIEKNHEALKRILAMLVALVGMTGGETGNSSEASGVQSSDRPATLPRHLHRFVLRLLRPAEAATRRLIFIAAHGLTVKLPKVRPRKPKPKPEPRIIHVLDRVNGSIVSVPIVLPEPPPPPAAPRKPSLSLPLLDPFKRFGARRRYARPAVQPSIQLIGDPGVPLRDRLFTPVPMPDDLLDAARIHQRLAVIGRALDDLPKQALRMARWTARKDARLAAERLVVEEGNEVGDPPVEQAQSQFPGSSSLEGSPSPSRASPSPPLPHFVGARKGCQAGAPPAPPRFLAPTEWGRGGEGEARDGEGGVSEQHMATCEKLGISPKVLALCRRAKLASGSARSNIPADAANPPRVTRLSPLRPGRPPGWRKRGNHDVYEVLDELHGLAIWRRERRDSS